MADLQTHFVGDQTWGFSVWLHTMGVWARGMNNANTRNAVNSGNMRHYDRLNGGVGEQLPSALLPANQYLKTIFSFKKRGQSGADVEDVDGLHPSQYPGSTWNSGNNFGDFKPNTKSGIYKFNSSVRNGVLPPNTQLLPYASSSQLAGTEQ